MRRNLPCVSLGNSGSDSEVDYILSFLDHENFDRRETAIYCISSFDLEAEKLEQVKDRFFRIPNTEQQVQLLKYIHRILHRTDLDFFKAGTAKRKRYLKLEYCRNPLEWRLQKRSSGILLSAVCCPTI